jgi:hypothetical protein
VSPKNSVDKLQPGEGSPAAHLANTSNKEMEVPGKTIEKLQDLLRRAEKGEENAVPEIRQILNEHPKLAWDFVDLGKVAEDALIEYITREQDLATKELIRYQLEAMKKEIVGNEHSPLERLLSERVVVTWLEVQLFEALYVRNMRNLSLPQAEHHQKRLDRAHRRHLSAIRALAQIRKLLKGTTIAQINIADKQINTTG